MLKFAVLAASVLGLASWPHAASASDPFATYNTCIPYAELGPLLSSERASKKPLRMVEKTLISYRVDGNRIRFVIDSQELSVPVRPYVAGELCALLPPTRTLSSARHLPGGQIAALLAVLAFREKGGKMLADLDRDGTDITLRTESRRYVVTIAEAAGGRGRFDHPVIDCGGHEAYAVDPATFNVTWIGTGCADAPT